MMSFSSRTRPGVAAAADVGTSAEHPARRSPTRGWYRVRPQDDENRETVYAVIAASGVALYTFSDLRDATAEAAELNTQDLHLAASP